MVLLLLQQQMIAVEELLATIARAVVPNKKPTVVVVEANNKIRSKHRPAVSVDSGMPLDAHHLHTRESWHSRLEKIIWSWTCRMISRYSRR